MSDYPESTVYLIRRAYESELATLREQVKVLRDALEGLLSIVPDIYNHMILQKQIARAALEQAKPKDGK